MDEKFDTLKTVSEYTVNLINGIEKAVEYFQSGEDRKGCELISPITEGIQWMSDALVVTKDIHEQDMNLQDMNEKLSEIVEALENEDYILIGDLFQYELIPLIDDIQKNINKVLAS
jgi:predicted RNA-binding protein with EMAP domain